MEIQANQLILSATIIFIVGLIIFSVAFQAYGIMVDLKRTMGVNVTDSEVATITSLLSLIPGVLTLIYFAFVGTVIWYVMRRSNEEQQWLF